ncbi:MAG: STT3 domain-containing protein [Phycisphaerae bacterium]
MSLKTSQGVSDDRLANAGCLLLAAAIVLGGIALELPAYRSIFALTRQRDVDADKGDRPAGQPNDNAYTPRIFFPDPDDYLRTYRAKRIVAGESIRIRHMPDLNHPDGVELHWTAVMDFLLAGAGILVAGLTTHPDPAGIAAAWIPVALGALYVACMIGWLRRGFGWGPGLLAGLLIIASPAYHRAFQLGHADHHALLELLFVVALGAWAGRIRDDGNPGVPPRSAAIISGVAIGLAIWTATFSLLVWGAILVGIHVACRRADASSRPAFLAAHRAWCMTVAGVVAAGYVFENWPDLGSVAIDKISTLHLTGVLIAWLVPIGGATRTSASSRTDDPSTQTEAVAIAADDQGRVTRKVLLLLAVAATVVWFATRQDRVLEPVRSPELSRWHDLNAELQPLITHAGRDWSLKPMHDRLGFLPYALPIALPLFLLSKRVPPVVKVGLGVLGPVITLLCIRHLRFTDHFNLAVVPIVVIGAGEGVDRIFFRGRSPQPMIRFAASVGILLLLAIPYRGWLDRLSDRIDSPPPIHLQRTDFVAMAIREYERTHGASADGRRAILCEEGEGPMLLYETGLPVVAAPYHRAIGGIVQAARFYSERDPHAARARLDRLGVRYVVMPFRAHEQLMNFERIAFGELQSFDPPKQWLDPHGNPRQALRYRPEYSKTMAYRLWAHPQSPCIEGLELIRGITDDPQRPNAENGLLYAVHGIE